MGKHIIFHVTMVNTEDVSEETRDIGFGKSNAGYCEALETCDIDLGPQDEVCGADRSFAVNMMDCEEHVVVCLVQKKLGELLGNTIEFGIELLGIEKVQDNRQLLIVELWLSQVMILVMDLHAREVIVQHGKG